MDNLPATVEQLSSRFVNGDSVLSNTAVTESMDKFAGVLDDRISSTSALLDAQVTEIKKTCTQTFKTANSAQQQPVIVRSCNTVLFDVDECSGYDSTLRSKVDDISVC